MTKIHRLTNPTGPHTHRRFPAVLIAAALLPAACDMGRDTVVLDQRDAASAEASALVTATPGNQASGEVRFRQIDGQMEISGKLVGLAQGKHGFHIHQNGDCADAAAAAGGHFAPAGDRHGAPGDATDQHHVGDLGNIVADGDGVALIDLHDAEMTLGAGPNSILGRSVIVHADPDDLESQPSGAAGSRVACGVIRGESLAESTG